MLVSLLHYLKAIETLTYFSGFPVLSDVHKRLLCPRLRSLVYHYWSHISSWVSSAMLDIFDRYAPRQHSELPPRRNVEWWRSLQMAEDSMWLHLIVSLSTRREPRICTLVMIVIIVVILR